MQTHICDIFRKGNPMSVCSCTLCTDIISLKLQNLGIEKTNVIKKLKSMICLY